MKVSASGESVRQVLLRIKAEGDPGNAQRIKQEAQRIKQAEAQAARERSGRQKQSTKYLSDEEAATAKYWLARMQREKLYAAEKKRIDNEEAARRKKIADDELKRQREIARERQRAEREQMRWGTQLSREYDRRIAKEERDRKRAATAAEREQMRWGTSLAAQMDRDIATRARTRREFAEAARIRQGRTNRLGISGIGQDAIGVLRGVGHVGVASGLFGESTESILEGLLAVEGGFNIARYGSPLLTNLARTRGVRRGLFGGARALSGLLGVGVGVGGTAGGTALGGAVGLAGAAGGAAIGGGLGTFAAFDFARQVRRNGLFGGADPGSFTDTVAGWEVNLARNRFVRGAANMLAPLPSRFGYEFMGINELDRTEERLRRQQLGAADIRRWAMGDEARFMAGMGSDLARTGSLLFGSGPLLERQLAQNRAQQGVLGGRLSATAVPGDPQSGYMLQGNDRAQALEQMRGIKQQEVALQEQMHARDMAHWRAVAQSQDEVLQKRLQEKQIVEEQVRGRAAALSEMSPGRLRALERAFQDATNNDGQLSPLNARLLNQNRGLIPGELPDLDRFNLDRARRSAPGITSRLDQAIRDADARIQSVQTASENFAEKMTEVGKKLEESINSIRESATKVIDQLNQQILDAKNDAIDEAIARGETANGQTVRAPGSAI